LHGPYGEDGTIQGLLEMADMPYVGSGVLASAVAMDKSFAKPIFASHDIATAPGVVVKAGAWKSNATSITKEIADIPFVGSGVLASAVAMDKSFAKPIFAAHGIKVAEGLVIRQSDWKSNKGSLSADVATLGYPVFVKPARGGSSRGTTKVKSAEHLTAAVEEAHRFDPKAMVENAVIGREIECAVLEINGKPEASIVGQIEIDSKFEFYDFEAKYLDGATSITLPAPISEGIAAQIQSRAVEAFVALGCSGLARVDFFLTPNGEVIINELNTMPGFTATSVFPKMWAASGVGYTEVITHLLVSALTRNNGVLGN